MTPWPQQVFAHPGEDRHRQAVVDAVTARLAGRSLWTMSLHAPNGDELDVPGYARADLGDRLPSGGLRVNFGALSTGCVIGGAVLHGPGDVRVKLPFTSDTLVYAGSTLTVDYDH